MSRPLPPPPTFDWDQLMATRDITHDQATGLPYPEPSIDRPSDEELWEWVFDGICPANDGCEVEPDGICPHGHPAWPRRLGIV